MSRTSLSAIFPVPLACRDIQLAGFISEDTSPAVGQRKGSGVSGSANLAEPNFKLAAAFI